MFKGTLILRTEPSYFDAIWNISIICCVKINPIKNIIIKLYLGSSAHKRLES